MHFEIKTFFQLDDRSLFLDFCEQAAKEIRQPAAENMYHPDWINNPNILPYQLIMTDRYLPPKGEFYFLLFNNQIIACSGIYQSEFNEQLVIAGCRTWINKEFRNLSIAREYLLPAQKKWAEEKNYSAIALTFNDYNKNIIEIFKKRRLGENRSPRESKHLFYSNFNQVDHPINIQFTKQWIIYETLNEDWDFDWKTLTYE
jgi:hypothetical protein